MWKRRWLTLDNIAREIGPHLSPCFVDIFGGHMDIQMREGALQRSAQFPEFGLLLHVLDKMEYLLLLVRRQTGYFLQRGLFVHDTSFPLQDQRRMIWYTTRKTVIE